MIATAVVCAAFLGGCCCTTADHTITIVDVDGDRWDEENDQWVLIDPPNLGFPDAGMRLHIESGQTVCFLNTTDRKCTVKANAGVYTEGNVFSIKKHKCTKRTTGNLTLGDEINHVINCGPDHGAPSMIVVPVNHKD